MLNYSFSYSERYLFDMTLVSSGICWPSNHYYWHWLLIKIIILKFINSGTDDSSASWLPLSVLLSLVIWYGYEALAIWITFEWVLHSCKILIVGLYWNWVGFKLYKAGSCQSDLPTLSQMYIIWWKPRSSHTSISKFGKMF